MKPKYKKTETEIKQNWKQKWNKKWGKGKSDFKKVKDCDIRKKRESKRRKKRERDIKKRAWLLRRSKSRKVKWNYFIWLCLCNEGHK